MTPKQQEREDAKAKLREMIKPGDTIHTILRHVSRSGMCRRISLIHIDETGEPYQLDYFAAKALDLSLDRRKEGLKIGGCGMDMGFHLVYSLASTLYPDGFTCIGENSGPNRCPSNDHSNGDRDYTPHTHRDGGYALRHRWL